MAEEKKKTPKRGCVARLLFAISATSSLLLAAAMVIMMLPQDLADIEGYGEGAKNRQTRDLTAVLRESVERGHKVTLTEEEINRWIGQTLKIKQKGMLGGAVKINGLGVRLKDNVAEIVIERSVMGLKSTQSMYLQVVVEADETASSKEVLLHGGPIASWFPPLKRGGRFGLLTVPRGYLYLVKPSFFQLGEVYKEELELAFRKMHVIALEKGQLVLTPSQAAIPTDVP